MLVGCWFEYPKLSISEMMKKLGKTSDRGRLVGRQASKQSIVPKRKGKYLNTTKIPIIN